MQSSLYVLLSTVTAMLESAVSDKYYTSDKSCAVGFLNRESLFLIVDTSSSDTGHPELEEYLMTDTNQSMPLNKSGHLEKFVIAAKLNHDIASGWPILQIMRKVGKNSTSAVDMTMSEPRPTGYLNVYEYDTSMNVEVGDVVHIQWPAEVVRTSESRYLLAYLIQGGTRKPLIYINVSSLSPSQMTSIIPAISAVDLITANKITTLTSLSSVTVFAVTFGALFILVVFISLSVIGIIIVFVVRHKIKVKKPSAKVTEIQDTCSAGEVIEVDINQAYITNTVPTEPNIAYSTSVGHTPHDYDYVVL